jgi:hypothetical protein
VFALDDDSPPDPSAIAAAALLRLPNRRDLGVADGLRLRLTDGTILAPRAVAALLDAEIEPPDALMTIPLVLGHDRYASVWCVSLTRDRISSPASGPYLAHTGQAPLAVPNLAVTRQNDSDHAAWPSPGTGVQAALERSRDGGATWERASPWLPATATARVMPIPAGPRFYRLVLRRPQGAPVAGPPVEPVE